MEAHTHQLLPHEVPGSKERAVVPCNHVADLCMDCSFQLLGTAKEPSISFSSSPNLHIFICQYLILHPPHVGLVGGNIRVVNA
jgi:hypothetical protein